MPPSSVLCYQQFIRVQVALVAPYWCEKIDVNNWLTLAVHFVPTTGPNSSNLRNRLKYLNFLLISISNRFDIKLFQSNAVLICHTGAKI